MLSASSLPLPVLLDSRTPPCRGQWARGPGSQFNCSGMCSFIQPLILSLETFYIRLRAGLQQCKTQKKILCPPYQFQKFMI